MSEGADSEVLAVQNADSESTGTSSQPTKKKNLPRIENKKADGTIEYPFLKQRDPRDVELFNQVALNQPYAQKNATMRAWDNVALNMSEKLGSDGKPIFLGGQVTGKSAKERFDKICASSFKNYNKNAPWRSGTDDEEETNFSRNVEQTLEKYHTWTLEKDSVHQKSTADKQRERQEADVVKRAGMGDLATGEIRALRGGKKKSASTPSSGRSTPSSTATSVFKATSLIDLSESDDLTRQALDARLERTELRKREVEIAFERYEEEKKQKIFDQQMQNKQLELQNKKLDMQLEMQSKQLEMQSKQLDMQAESQRLQAEAQQRQHELMLAMLQNKVNK